MITQLTLPASEPVSLADMKSYLKVDHTDEDALINILIPAARRRAEHLTGQIIAQRTFRVDACKFGDGVLPLSPVQSVSAVQYLDINGALQTLLGVDFFPYPLSPQIFAPTTGWPTVKSGKPNAVQVICTAGMSPVPEDIVAWVMLRVSTAFENRNAITDLKVGELPDSFVDGLLDAYCVVRV
ncbi:head-tail connector protein [Deefgea rivuli]|uniref:head-tail connector protein n=1 Tax=Deefgea rivuli TaxID=400948 RepID=UPI00068604BC|nr:head-tail connector protein [Deefgea rivuli]